MEIKDNIVKNMSDLLQRGETIESLMEKSKDLSTNSVRYYKASKKVVDN